LALDPKTVKQLNNIIKILASTGDEVSKKSRELVTLMYAIQQGFVDVGDKMDDVLSDISSGKFEQRNFKVYLKTLGMTEDQLSTIQKIHKEIHKLSDDQIIKAKDYGTILDDIHSIESDRYDLTKLTISAFDDITRELDNQQKLLESAGISMGGNAELLSKQLKKHNALKNAFDNELITTQEIQDQLSSIGSVIDNITAKSFDIDGKLNLNPEEAINYLNSVSEEQEKLILAEDELRRQKLKAFAAFATDKKIDLKTGDLFNASGTKLKGASHNSVNKQLDSMVSKYEDIIDKINSNDAAAGAMLSTMSEATQEIIKQAAHQKEMNRSAREQLDLTQQNLSSLLRFRPALKSAESAGEGLADAFESMINVLPPTLQKITGLSGVADDVRESTQDAIKTFNRTLVNTGSSTKAIKTSINQWGKGIGNAIGFGTGFLAVLGGLFKLTSSIEGKYLDMAGNIGISIGQAKELFKTNKELLTSQENQYLTMSDITDAQAAYVASTGQVFSLTEKGGQNLIMQLGEIGKAFGYNAETAMGIYDTFSQLGADTELSNKLQTELGFMSEMAGLTPKLVANDLIDGAETVATYFAGMPEEAAKATLEIRRMGMNIKQAGNIAREMLNLDGFMTNMYELNAMGGPDLSAAFDAGIRGDVEGMTEAIMDSIGTLQNFNDMDFTQRIKLAETLGMSTDELGKSVMLRERLMGLGKEQRKIVESNMHMFGNIADMDQAAIEARIDEVKSTQKLSVAWEKIKAVFIKSILPATESFAEFLSNSSPLIDAIIGGFKGIGIIVKGVAYFVSGMLLPLKVVADIVGQIQDYFKRSSNEADDLNESASNVGSTIASLISGAGTFFAVWKFGGGKIIKTLATKVGLLDKATDLVGGMGKKAKGLAKGGGLLGKLFGKAPNAELDEVSKRVGDIGAGKVRSLFGGELEEVDIPNNKKKFELLDDELGGKSSKLGDKMKKVGEGSDKIKSGKGAALKEFFTGLGDGLKAMSGGKVLFGALNLIPASLGLVAMIPGTLGAKLISTVKGDSLRSGLVGIADGLVAMGNGKALLGAVGLVLAAAGFVAMIPGAVGMFLLGAAAPIAATGLSVLTPALITFGTAMTTGVGLVGLVAFVGAAAGLAYALKQLAPLVEKFAPVVGAFGTVIRNAFEGLASIVTAVADGFYNILGAVTMKKVAAMAALGPALISAATGMVTFAGASIAGGIGSLFSGGVLDDLERIADVADPLDVASKAVSLLGESIRGLMEALSTTDFSKLSEFEKLKGIADNVGIGFKMRGAESTVVQPPSAESTAQNVAVPEPPSAESTAQNVVIKEVPSESSTFDGTSTSSPIQGASSGFGQGSSTKKIEMLLGQLIGEIRGLNNRPVVIDFGDGVMKDVNRRLKGMNNNR
jgi:hypothetical protein